MAIGALKRKVFPHVYCRFCGKQINDGSVYCPYCGEKQNSGQEEKTDGKFAGNFASGRDRRDNTGQNYYDQGSFENGYYNNCPPNGGYYNGGYGNNGYDNRPRPIDAPNAGWGVLGFFFPLIGLILFLVWKDEYPNRSKMCGKGALISVIVYFALVILFLLIIMIIMVSAATASVSPSAIYY